MDFSDYIRVLRRSWLAVVLAALIGGGGAAAYALHQTPEYEADASVLVTVNAGTSINDITVGASYAEQVVATYAELATKPIVLQPVITDLGLRTTVEELAERVTVTASTSTTVIDIAADDASPSRAAAIVNGISDQLQTVVASISPSTDGATTIRLTSVQEAVAPDDPIAPNVSLTILIGTVGAAALVLAIVVLRAALDTRLRRPEDVAGATTVPVIGTISDSRAFNKRVPPVRARPDGLIAGAFRSLRTNLQFLVAAEDGQTIVVSSPSPGEGKTTTVANLAVAIADAGASVVVVDANLRRPAVARVLRIKDGVGLSEVLIGQIPIDEALQTWGLDARLAVITSGALPPNPSELLQSPAMNRLLNELERKYDLVLVDAPPLLPVPDAALLGHRSAGTVVVAASRATTHRHLADAVTKIEQANGRPLGVVMTKVPTRGADAAVADRYRPSRRRARWRPQSS